MQDKLLALLIYGILGLALALAPLFVTNQTLKTVPDESPKHGHSLVALMVATALFYYTQANLFINFLYAIIAISILLSARYWDSFRKLLAGFTSTLLACTVSATLPWWRVQSSGIQLTIHELIWFSSLFVVCTTILLTTTRKCSHSTTPNYFSLAIYAVVVGFISYTLAPTENSQILATLWHHWGAYIDPSQLVIAGVHPLGDIPVQYGMGPTILISLLCRADCWETTYFVASTFSFVFALLVGFIAWNYSSQNHLRNILILILCTLTCMFWVSYPPSVSSPIVTPSTSGLRFLPATVLTAWVFYTTQRVGKLRNVGGHIIWAICAFWSPECLFYATAIWWPIYIFDQSRLTSGTRGRIFSGLRSTAVLSTVAICTIITVCVGYFFIYNSLPNPLYFLTYILYPPGPLPINPKGTLIFWGYTMILAASVSWTMWLRSGESTAFTRSLTLQLLAFSTLSYYLGRSHDNNILNLSPLFMLVLLDALSNARSIFSRHSAACALSALLAWPVVFGWNVWQEAYSKNGIRAIGFSEIKNILNYDEPTQKSLHEVNTKVDSYQLAQTKLLMDQIQKDGESFVVLDEFNLQQPYYSLKPWCAIMSSTNFAFVPSTLRREFLFNTARRLNRSGWLIISKSHDPNTWLSDFDAVYDRTNSVDLDSVYAIRYTPKVLDNYVVTNQATKR